MYSHSSGARTQGICALNFHLHQYVCCLLWASFSLSPLFHVCSPSFSQLHIPSSRENASCISIQSNSHCCTMGVNLCSVTCTAHKYDFGLWYPLEHIWVSEYNFLLQELPFLVCWGLFYWAPAFWVMCTPSVSISFVGREVFSPAKWSSHLNQL